MNTMGRAACAAMLAGALALPAGTALGASKGKMYRCGKSGATISAGVTNIRAQKVGCADARTTVRAVEAHANFCRPQKGTQAFRRCIIEPVFAAGPRVLTCESYFIDNAHYIVHCRDGGKGSHQRKVYWHRNQNVKP